MTERSTTPTIVGYPGRDGAHSAAACDRLFPDGAELVPLPSFAAVTQATADGTIDVGVLPIESSLAGPVAETHDLLYDSPLAITGETVLPIRHFLVGPEKVSLDAGARGALAPGRARPVPRCSRRCPTRPRSPPPRPPTRPRTSPSSAIRRRSRSRASAPPACTASTVVAEDVGDHPEAFTRFVSVATHMRLDVNGKPWRTAFSFVTDHQPGALHRAIEPFARHGIDLLQLVSRPIPQSPWRYRFDAVLAGPSPRPDRARDARRAPRAHAPAPRVRLLSCGGPP